MAGGGLMGFLLLRQFRTDAFLLLHTAPHDIPSSLGGGHHPRRVASTSCSFSGCPYVPRTRLHTYLVNVTRAPFGARSSLV